MEEVGEEDEEISKLVFHGTLPVAIHLAREESREGHRTIAYFVFQTYTIKHKD